MYCVRVCTSYTGKDETNDLWKKAVQIRRRYIHYNLYLYTDYRGRPAGRYSRNRSPVTVGISVVDQWQLDGGDFKTELIRFLQNEKGSIFVFTNKF